MRVELRSIIKGYKVRGGTGGMVTVLDGIDLTVASGETCLIHGPTGSGKSTLLAIVAGVALPGSGTVLWDDNAPNLDGCNKIPARDIGYAFQEPQLLDELTVRENLLLPAVLGKHHRLAEKGEQLLVDCGLSDRFDYFPAALSGGEKRRLAIAMTLLVSSRLLVIDEPTAYLDDIWGERLMEVIMRETVTNRSTLIVASHDSRLRPCFERIMKMDGGRLKEEGRCDN